MEQRNNSLVAADVIGIPVVAVGIVIGIDVMDFVWLPLIGPDAIAVVAVPVD